MTTHKNRMGRERKKARKHIHKLIKKYNNKCYLCDIEVRYGHPYIDFPNKRTIDHIIPLNNGGTNHYDNLALCCSQCNKDKADLMPEYCSKCWSHKIQGQECRKC